MFGPFRQKRPVQRTQQMAHEMVDAVIDGNPKRVLVVGDEAEAVATVLRGRMPEAAVVAVRHVDGLQRWQGWSQLTISAWTTGVDEITLASRLKQNLPGGSVVAVLDRGATTLVDALQREFSPLNWDIGPREFGGASTLRFVGQVAA